VIRLRHTYLNTL